MTKDNTVLQIYKEFDRVQHTSEELSLTHYYRTVQLQHNLKTNCKKTKTTNIKTKQKITISEYSH